MGDAPGSNPQYFDSDPAVPSRVVTYEIAGPSGPLSIASDAGVFSHGSLDKATAILLDHLRTLVDDLPEGDFIDVGCGAGPIAVLLAARFPRRRVWAVDTNSRALELCASNARANSLDNMSVCAPDDVPRDLSFALVCSNPPIRVGKNALHEILRTWLGRLHNDGTAIMVVGKNLGADSLQAWLTQNGWPTERLASSKGFRLFRSSVTRAQG
jgi:SAM-dependent methyltransferase